MPHDDTLGRVYPGDQPPTSARWYDRLTDAARRAQRTQLGEGTGAGGDPLETPVDPANTVLIRAVGAALAPFTISRYGTAPIAPTAGTAPEARRRPVFDFAVPAAKSDNVAVTVEDAPAAGGLARAAAAGVVPARVNVTSSAHTRAVPVPGDSEAFASAATGGYPILWKPAGTGVKWCYVLLDRGGAVAGVDCNSCAFLAEIPTTACLLLKMRGGDGRCACAPADPTDDDSGVVLAYSGSLTTSLATPTWVGAVGVNAAGEVDPDVPALGRTCCGAGMALFQPTGDLTANLTFQGVHVSCQPVGSGPGAVFSTTLTQVCCGVDPDTGRKYALYFGKGPDSCSGEVGPCGNVFFVRVECLVSCPQRTCRTATACDEKPSPVAYYFGVTGSSTTTRDGNWVVTRALDDAGGPWTATSNGITYTLTLTPDPTHPVIAPLWSLTNGEATYEVRSLGCDVPQTLLKVSGTGPASVIISPIAFAGEGEQECCCETLLTGLKVTMSAAVCGVQFADELMDAEGTGDCNRQKTAGGGGATPGCDDGGLGRNSCKGYGVRVTCNPDGTFNVYSVAGYSGPPTTLNIVNLATTPGEILFTVTYTCTDADCDECGGAGVSQTLTFTNM